MMIERLGRPGNNVRFGRATIGQTATFSVVPSTVA